jgi:hypothetical protein
VHPHCNHKALPLRPAHLQVWIPKIRWRLGPVDAADGVAAGTQPRGPVVRHHHLQGTGTGGGGWWDEARCGGCFAAGLPRVRRSLSQSLHSPSPPQTSPALPHTPPDVQSFAALPCPALPCTALHCTRSQPASQLAYLQILGLGLQREVQDSVGAVLES